MYDSVYGSTKSLEIYEVPNPVQYLSQYLLGFIIPLKLSMES